VTILGLADPKFALQLKQLHKLLASRGETVAVAESLTGGLLAAALTQTAGASATFRGGLVVYATDLKVSLAGVDALLIHERGAVDGAVASALAQGARDRLSASWGIGVTGVAGPEPQDGKPVGTVFISVVSGGSREVIEHRFGGNRNSVRLQSVNEAVLQFLDTIRNLPEPGTD
jgi:nicotinamide-nucleotide amidase